jgi:phospholipase/lecithinase/hemolysin
LFISSHDSIATKQYANPHNSPSQQRLIKAGATHLVVPGNLPMGCSSAYLTLHPGRNGSDYDDTGCLKTYNDFAQHHNAVLQQKLQALRIKYPQARIMYADYYGAAMSFAKNPKQFGEYLC